MKNLISKCEINSLGNLNVTFPALSYARLTLYSTGDEQGDQKNGRFTATVWPPLRRQTNQQTPGIYFPPSYLGLRYQIMPDRGKALDRKNE